jgi:hypothetical protein
VLVYGDTDRMLPETWTRGKVTGGSTTVNGMMCRPPPADRTMPVPARRRDPCPAPAREGQEHAMSPCYGQERQLRRMEAGLRRSDPHLDGMLGLFAWLYAGHGMPAWEQVPSGRDRSRLSAWFLRRCSPRRPLSLPCSGRFPPPRGAPAPVRRLPGPNAPATAGKPVTSRTHRNPASPPNGTDRLVSPSGDPVAGASSTGRDESVGPHPRRPGVRLASATVPVLTAQAWQSDRTS